ncbi:MAG: hypothetical protein IJ683_06950 [Butyrivibrio sp.]|nr:hypothetical protein [Butyrivibrio sp.]MBR1642041.1 hypothetical protein [Butyrivibrio sp.]
MASKAFKAIIKLVENLIKAPIKRFWRSFEKSLAKKDYLQIFLSLLISLICLLGIGFLLVIVFIKITEIVLTHPLPFAAVAGVIAMYFHVAEEKKEEKKTEITSKENTIQRLREQAEKGYAPMANVIFQCLMSCAKDISARAPVFMKEIEVPEGHYVIREEYGIFLYQFKIDKEDMHTTYDEGILQEFTNNIQYTLHSKLHADAFPSIKLHDFQDKYGNIYDGIVIVNVTDFGRYFLIHTAYASDAYSDYNIIRQRKVNEEVGSHDTEDWDSKK